jgi:hypothetical protein
MILEISLGSIHMPRGENNLLQLTKKMRPLASENLRE